jgi:excisionase family DNA binding protein
LRCEWWPCVGRALGWWVAVVVGLVLEVMELRLSNDARMLSARAAASVAGCSVKTIRRAYSSGTLVAYRDAGGRGVRIRYGDLRNWMMCEVVAAVGDVDDGVGLGGSGGSSRRSARASENLQLLLAARESRVASLS